MITKLILKIIRKYDMIYLYSQNTNINFKYVKVFWKYKQK